MRSNLLHVSVAASIVLVAVPASAAPTAQEILAKSRAAMKSVKTYQATIQTTTSGGPMSMTMNAHIKTANGKAWAQMGVVPSGGGQQNPFASMLQNMIIVDDGKNTWTYIPAMKQYRKGPSGGAKQLNMTNEMLAKLDTDANLSVAGSENVGGRPAYIVDAKPKAPRPGQPQSVRMYFDQATYHVVQLRAVQNRPASPQAPAAQQSVQVVIKDEKVNQPIPDTLFHFAPPAGSTEMQMGMGMRPSMGTGRQAPHK
jgi:outer membrane lipoprotein-sorting protein